MRSALVQIKLNTLVAVILLTASCPRIPGFHPGGLRSTPSMGISDFFIRQVRLSDSLF